MGKIVVAIPVKDEEDRIAACVEAIEMQCAGAADHVVLLLNNCTDRTADIVRSMQARLGDWLDAPMVTLLPAHAHAGVARHLAMERAAELAGEDGILLTTDADARVDPDWIGANLAGLKAGADAVAGWVELDPIDWSAIPLALHEDDARECAYDAFCDEIHALLDPDPADPFPRHTQASGASIAVTTRAYRAARGIPLVPTGEDRAFLAALRAIDARIRHAPECRVVVSGRTEGRAAGGMADTIKRRLTAPDALLDDRLEPAEACGRRAALRHMARQVHAEGLERSSLADALGLTWLSVDQAMDKVHFGMAWSALEKASPRLSRRPVSVHGLAAEHAAAKHLRDWALRDPAACRSALLLRAPIA